MQVHGKKIKTKVKRITTTLLSEILEHNLTPYIYYILTRQNKAGFDIVLLLPIYNSGANDRVACRRNFFFREITSRTPSFYHQCSIPPLLPPRPAGLKSPPLPPSPSIRSSYTPTTSMYSYLLQYFGVLYCRSILQLLLRLSLVSGQLRGHTLRTFDTARPSERAIFPGQPENCGRHIISAEGQFCLVQGQKIRSVSVNRYEL